MMNSRTLGNTKPAALGFQSKQTVRATRAAKRTNGIRTLAIAAPAKPSPGKLTTQNGAGQSEICLHGDLSEDILRKAKNIGALELGPAEAYRGTAQSVREHLIEAFNKTQEYWR